jgi:UDP-N-acetylmuramoyl-L-alanyl-D-glutamate--2,6-diaminopimelate ligase
MKLAELASGLPLPDGVAELTVTGLAADSRHVRPGMVFAALKGARQDGLAYAAQAVERGAILILAGPEAETVGLAAPVLRCDNPRAVLAKMSARFFGRQPAHVVGVTGTNGKTSVTSFLRQIWAKAGFDAASLGTVGVKSAHGELPLSHTTPDAITLHEMLAHLTGEGVTHLALEASSHGLDQYRLDGVAFEATAFTNITRDHLDYHACFEDYFQAKLRLFRELTPAGSSVVADADAPGAACVIAQARSRGLRVYSVGRAGSDIVLRKAERSGFGQLLQLNVEGRQREVLLPLTGEFQLSNALIAAALGLATGCNEDIVLAALENLKGAKGRLELTGANAQGAPVFIDYAHTPDALAKALQALRPYVQDRLHVVFGCGGDRDPGKRGEMGRIAAAHADAIIVTDDNPRGEDPAAIRRAILSSAPGALEIGSRAEAIATAIATLKAGDVLLIAGKGHETGQIMADRVVPFSDHEEVAKALRQTAGPERERRGPDGC